MVSPYDPNGRVANPMRWMDYPAARAANPGGSVGWEQGGFGPGSMLTDTWNSPFANEPGGLQGSRYGGDVQSWLSDLANPSINRLAPGPNSGHKKNKPTDPLDALMASVLAMGAAGSSGQNAVQTEINRQMSALKGQAADSKNDLIKYSKNAIGDTNVLYGHLKQYLKNTGAADNIDYRNTLQGLGKDTSKAAKQTSGVYKSEAAKHNAELTKLGLSVANPGMAADRRADVARVLADGADAKANIRFQGKESRSLNRQMRADSAMERGVAVTGIRRDTQKALGDLQKQLQSQLGQLRMSAAQAASSGQDPLDHLGKAVGIAKTIQDLKNARDGLKTGKKSASSKRGFQAALDYLHAKGGSHASTLQSLINQAYQAGNWKNDPNAGLVGGDIPFKWDAGDTTGIMNWAQDNAGGEWTPDMANQFARALRIAFGQD